MSSRRPKVQEIRMGNLTKQNSEISRDIRYAMKMALKKSDFILGEAVSQFESDFASYTGARHCIGVGNGTDALEIMLLALDLPKGSAVILPANTFVATAEAILNVGLRPKFVDIREDFTFDREDFADAAGNDVSAVIVVHLYGYPNVIDWMPSYFPNREIPILEDCAQGHGARIGGKHVGTLGTAGAFSFFPGKNLGALGDAGAIVTNDEKFALTCRRIANHGRLGKFDHEIVGRNSRLDTIQAAILAAKLRRLDTWNGRRRENAKMYRESLGHIGGLILPPVSENFEVYHHFVIQSEFRDQLRDHLRAMGVETGIHYPQSLDELVPFSQFSPAKAMARKLARSILSLPVAEHLTKDEIKRVCNVIKEFFETSKLDEKYD